MRGRIYNKFKILLSQKEIEEKKRIPYKEINEITGITISSLSAWATNNVQRFDADTISALCEYFGCNVGDLIVYESIKKR
jgi:putative transcriptional regulator